MNQLGDLISQTALHVSTPEDFIESNFKKKILDKNLKKIDSFNQIEEEQTQQMEEKLVISINSMSSKRHSNAFEKPSSNVIVYEENPSTGGVKSYNTLPKDEFKLRSQKNSRKASYLAPKTTKKDEDTKRTSKEKENGDLLEQIRKIVKDSTIVFTEKNDSSAEDSDEEKQPIPLTPSLNNFSLKREKDFLNTVHKRKTKELTSAIMPAFANLKKTERNFSVNADAANSLLIKIIESEGSKKTRNHVTKNNILKMIGTIYSEKLTNSQNNINNPLHILIYDLFLNKYGLKKIAESKLKQVRIKKACKKKNFH